MRAKVALPDRESSVKEDEENGGGQIIGRIDLLGNQNASCTMGARTRCMTIKRGIWGDEDMQGKRRALILLHKGGSYCLKVGWAVEKMRVWRMLGLEVQRA